MGADRNLVAPPRPGVVNGSAPLDCWLLAVVVLLVVAPPGALFFRIDMGDSFKFDGAVEDTGIKAEDKVAVKRQNQKWRNLSMVF